MLSRDKTPPPVHPSLCLNGTIFIALISPYLSIGKLVLLKRIRKNFNAVSRLLWHKISAAPNLHRISEMFVQMVDELYNAIL